MIEDEILKIVFIGLITLYSSWIIILLAPSRKRREGGYTPEITVVIPAHNEESVIRDTVESILTADYGNEIEVVVVNDGSTDLTEERIREVMDEDARIKLLYTGHKGKAYAINHGVENSTHDLIVTLDADSRIDTNALTEIIAPFSDKRVGAVSGIIRAIDNSNPLTWFQDFEYILSSGWRFVCNKINSTYIFPGFAAFRRNAMLDIGGFDRDTLSEDFDIGLKLKKKGYALVMSKATIYTMVPQTLRGLIKQRIRWGRGTVQVLRKHKDMPFNASYGMVGLYGIPTQIFWFIHGFTYIPIVLYQIFGGYVEYYILQNQPFTSDVARYFFSWFSIYGMIEYTLRTLNGEYAVNLLFYLITGVFILYITYDILVILKLAEFKMRYIPVLFFLFPYSLLVLSLHVFPSLYEIIFQTYFKGVRVNQTVNVWDKST